MSTESSPLPTVEVSGASGVVHEIGREEVRGAHASPRPLEDEELEAVSGAWSGTVTFPDGCVYRVTNANSEWEAVVFAEVAHSMAH